MTALKQIALIVATGACLSTLANTSVLPTGGLFDLGTFGAGSYQLTGSGVVDLVGDGSFLMNPDGTPVSTVTTPGYSYFNPSGSFIADSSFGPAGSNAKIGALIGTLNPTPTTSSDWFLIGYSDVVNLAVPGHIYAAVNDTYYPNDTGSFTVKVAAVPDVTGISPMLIGLGVIGAVKRRLKA